MAAAYPQAHVEVWACDEHRIGLKPILAKVWAFRGQRPLAPVQHRYQWCYQWCYLVGFVHPASGRTLWHLAPSVHTTLFSVELAAFARAAGAGPTKEVLLVLDRAGWHTSAQVVVPEHVHLLFLPPYSPELNPAEHLWSLTNTALVNRHFATLVATLDELADAHFAHCAVLQARRDLIRSTTGFHWWPQRVRKLQLFNTS